MKICGFVLCAVLFLLLPGNVTARQETPPEAATAWVVSSSPGPDEEVIAKTSPIQVVLAGPPAPQTLVVVLDGMDITQLVKTTETGFTYQPVFVLPPGSHTLNISGTDATGNLLQASIPFKTRHTASFEEATVSADMTGIYATTLRKDSSDGTTPYNAVTVEGTVQGKLREGINELSFEGYPVYVEQDKPLQTGSVEKGLDLRSFLIRGEHRGDTFQGKAEFGDVNVGETPFTVQGLLRRGTKLNLGYGNGTLSFFSVRSQAIYGIRRTLGMTHDQDNQIIGGSAGFSLPGIRTEIKATYLTGEDSSDLAYGISEIENGLRTGDVSSLRITSQIIPTILAVDFEAAYSRYDFDDADEFDEVSDTAWRVDFSGTVKQYTYDLKYEYIGRDFESIAVQGGTKDREGIYFMGNAMFPRHSLSVLASAFRDNVDRLSLMPRTINIPLFLDYNYTRFAEIPMGISFQHSILKTSDEPSGFASMETVTDAVTGKIAYIRPKWNTGLTTSYSYIDDRSGLDLDTSAANYTLTFTLAPREEWSISIVPNLVQQKNEDTGVRTDTYTTTVDLRSQPFRDLIYWDLGGSYSVSEATDDSVDTEITGINTRLACSLRRFFPADLNPAVALRGNYQRIKDKVADTKTDDLTLFLVFELQTKFGL
ncbi:MAG TPA: hypothetical protein PKY80_09720 [Syntrophales bacterium]|nr:hypothetical protein [Syntrophales bacterium]